MLRKICILYIQMDGYLVSLSVAIGVDGKGEKECDAGPFTLKVSWIEDETDTVVKVSCNPLWDNNRWL